MKFRIGQQVVVIPHKTPESVGPTLTVVDPFVPPDMKRIDGTPVGHYVLLSDGGKYHEDSLEAV